MDGRDGDGSEAASDGGRLAKCLRGRLGPRLGWLGPRLGRLVLEVVCDPLQLAGAAACGHLVLAALSSRARDP
ncbi:MAG TPA: hypothetical protein VHK22_03980 [Gaiellaceae bacterium]|nr:hypothetical protein [Gaiellaceae bacterium]